MDYIMKYLDKFASGIFSYFPEQWLTAVKLAVYSEFGFQVLATLICVYVIIYLNRHKLIDDSQPLRYRLRMDRCMCIFDYPCRNCRRYGQIGYIAEEEPIEQPEQPAEADEDQYEEQLEVDFDQEAEQPVYIGGRAHLAGRPIAYVAPRIVRAGPRYFYQARFRRFRRN